MTLLDKTSGATVRAMAFCFGAGWLLSIPFGKGAALAVGSVFLIGSFIYGRIG